MATNWAALVTTFAMVGSGWVAVEALQDPDLTSPTVQIVQTVGCATADGTSWYLTNATDPVEAEAPFASNAEMEAAEAVALGSNRFHLIGVAEFLDIEGLLNQFQRGDFTARESVNATGQLVAGHKVTVKGLFIEDTEPQRINLTSVISLGESCG